MDNYIALKVDSTDEILMALLTQFEFEAFEENEDHFIAYIKAYNLDEATKNEIIGLIRPYTESFIFENVANQNWNALWEASFQPVIVDRFCQIRAEFHPPEDGIIYDLIINPKMAFGTGHHATTHMMISQMADLDFNNKRVFDFGCGTGILAILASKLGAVKIDAIDIEHESYLNTIENCVINQVNNVIPYEGDINVMPEKIYDVILANINRNILVKYASELRDKINPGGSILISGVLEEDQSIVTDEYEVQGLCVHKVTNKDGWVCICMTNNIDGI